MPVIPVDNIAPKSTGILSGSSCLKAFNILCLGVIFVFISSLAYNSAISHHEKTARLQFLVLRFRFTGWWQYSTILFGYQGFFLLDLPQGAITNFGSSFGLVACAGGNLSEERFSPRPPSKDFFTAVPAAGTAAVTAQKFLKGGVGGNSFQRVSLPPSSLENGSNSRCDAVYAPEPSKHKKDQDI